MHLMLPRSSVTHHESQSLQSQTRIIDYKRVRVLGFQLKSPSKVDKGGNQHSIRHLVQLSKYHSEEKQVLTAPYITHMMEEQINHYTESSNPQVAAAGRMGEMLLWGVHNKPACYKIVCLVHEKVQELAWFAEWGFDIKDDLEKTKKELEEKIERELKKAS